MAVNRGSLFISDSDDPFRIIRLRKDKIVARWKREYTGEPATSWEEIFDNAEYDFEAYCEDEMSNGGDEQERTLQEQYSDGDINEYDMYDEFISFVNWVDMSDYDTVGD